MRKRCWIGLLALLLCFMPAMTRAQGEQRAKDITNQCKLNFGRYSTIEKRVLNWDISSRIDFDPGTGITVSWQDMVPAVYLCLQWYQLPEGVMVRLFDGAGDLIEEQELASHQQQAILLPQEVRAASITAGEGGMILSQLHVFGPGTLPDPFHLWQETPEQLDYLLISTHPDDDVLYLGSIVPIYGAEQGYVGTIAYVTCTNRDRRVEAENGAWEMGLLYRPLFMGFPDIPRDAKPERKAEFVYDDLVRDTVRLYRRYHPAVVFAQDENGEYGHWQHKLTSKAAVEAFSLAADPDYDPKSRDQFGLWQVQKVYLHLYEENVLLLDGNVPLNAFEGTTAWNVARKAFAKHKSQQGMGYGVARDDQELAFNRFGMIKGVVEAGDDAFANIPAEFLSTCELPAPNSTPAPTPADPS